MNPARVLSKMSPKTINYKSGGSGTANVDDVIDWRVAAHSLKGLSPEITNWAFYRFGGHDEKLEKVVKALMAYANIFVKMNKSKIKLETIEGIVRMTVAEFTQPVCLTCEGTGCIKLKPEDEVICGTCYGNGRKLMSKRHKCKVVGIDHKSYTDKHDGLSRMISKLLGDWETKIFKNVYSMMEDGETAQ
ncbi:hypothetical protein JQC92_02395 [Shewanella sp. 202IG2-18]|uniref:hypothetical protein n=1 Tax=Parashewanella hymeniacidonis TaxID=2807618 RepID=UPI0019617F09|nr:hypothetical protein [Parashewanella hymeniacidonis]MBM7070891.1 hypothetical protein [Parashewanella hymeniacidonis]